ncbi:DUF1365 domain-containing protein [Conexibacter stalactiti]|uniref:DUF1365 domain-containing protein n=1 Tax=Conexibacter stalactiti TaxID=1940611 RepID=A0ABU4HTA5_9ACTN|nr:DUF1365 domain-containing protein [Conexibacter stalactiti]MDW5596503.1 DUF1365 domain-containing protein [Conexibacter stalactiti]MEC5037145.1 DUF1365 domain-containing protein [Conexibacter stalactiti]
MPPRATPAPSRTAPVSAFYEGVVTHRRRTPVEHAFRARLYLLYLDLDELPQLFDGHPLWSARRRAVAWWRRADYLGDPAQPLGNAVRDLVQERLGMRPAGPVRMLTQVRTWGVGFNPVTFYWCFDAAGERAEAVVAEVTNTPWGERHAYVAGADGNADDMLVSRHRKALHVSPLMEMEQEYVWRISTPGERIAISIANERDGAVVFDAGLALRRRPITRCTLTTIPLRHPFMTVWVLVRIYLEALRLKLKGASWHGKPAAPGAADAICSAADAICGAADANHGAPDAERAEAVR